MAYTIITENDTSQWNDETGAIYHYPSRYQKILQPGTKVIYYKGRMRNKIFIKKRMTTDAHYFGTAVVGKFYKDSYSSKDDFYCQIENFIPFSKSVPIKVLNQYIEHIPENRKTNYFRDGVRSINKETFDKIISLSGISIERDEKRLVKYPTNDLKQGLEEAYESYELTEGAKKFRYSAYHERNPHLRLLAILIHGYDCQVCKFNFKEFYGEIGEGFIHIHHLKPISSYGKNNKVNPKEDLAALCANCHSMVHRYKNKIVSLEELRLYIGDHKKGKF
ncbi:MAG: HNH endonuclease [Bacteroidia bacterium]